MPVFYIEIIFLYNILIFNLDESIFPNLGRGAITPTLDVFMTLLSLGRKGYGKLVKERKEHFQCLLDKLKDFVNDYNCGTVIRTKGNPISIAISFNQISHENIAKELGARLFTRGVTGARAIVPGTIKNIDNHIIQSMFYIIAEIFNINAFSLSVSYLFFFPFFQ